MCSFLPGSHDEARLERPATVMKVGRYAASRKKNCQRCSNAKAKCDRKVGGCTRCATRGLPCTYPQVPTSRGSIHGEGDDGEPALSGPPSMPNMPLSPPGLPLTPEDMALGEDNSHSVVESYGINNASSITSTRSQSSWLSKLNAPMPISTKPDTFDFSAVKLFCPINTDEIRNRWLNSYVPDPGQRAKMYPPGVRAFIHRVLKSYAATAVHGNDVPPFVHPLQMESISARAPLATCLSLVRICEKPLPGSEGVAADVLEREMNSIYDRHRTYDDMALLAAFQAYLIYCMVLYFKLSQGPNSFLRQAMMNLQDLASSSSKCGLMCVAERDRDRPKWEAWIIVEAKRRTLFTMYLFDSLLLSEDGLSTYLGTELQGLPGPANKSLWNARVRREWEMAYNVHLANWPDEDFRIDELWPVPSDMDESLALERGDRVDRWVEKVDEFGTMMYAVTSCTHGV